MSQILSSTERDDGSVGSVTFVDDAGAVHTLTFHPEGADVSGDSEPVPRVVGTDEFPHHAFKDAREAVTAFERGEL